MEGSESLRQVLEDLTGQRAPLRDSIPSFPAAGLGYSQFNELLLLLGYDRVTHSFFQYIVGGTLEYVHGSSLASIQDLQVGVERVRQLSLLFFGNVKFGFKKLARDSDELSFYQEATQPISVTQLRLRNQPIYPLSVISPAETYYLGYLVQQEIKARLASDPADATALEESRVLERVQENGTRNHRAYLSSDHLDVYIATSMRRRHEYIEVAEFAQQLFKQDLLSSLNLRWFDPTQAYCPDRIDKGLAEALMLKRAKCTLYLAQESDTFGKDSELASTLAQGKPVIAYVPSPTDEAINDSVARLSSLYSRPPELVILERLQALSPDLAWNNFEVRRWIESPDNIDRTRALALLVRTTHEHYDKRARTLRESHPLGVQVNLDTGVANGVLVVRTVGDCAELIFRIVTSTLEFQIEKKTVGGVEYHMLKERVSNSVFRVMTGDAMLMNSFWNFYLEPSE